MPTAIGPALRCRRALRRAASPLALLAFVLGCASTEAATLTERAKEAGCVGKPKQVEGAMYKCETGSGASSYFNVPEMTGPAVAPAPKSGAGNGAAAVPGARAPTAGFPRVDAETQRGRDDVRRRVLQEELAAEEKLLAEARTVQADGAPPPLPEERNNAEKYRERIARLRQAVLLHERNVEALKKEIAGLR
jgi:hypothetical protein